MAFGIYKARIVLGNDFHRSSIRLDIVQARIVGGAWVRRVEGVIFGSGEARQAGVVRDQGLHLQRALGRQGDAERDC